MPINLNFNFEKTATKFKTLLNFSAIPFLSSVRLEPLSSEQLRRLVFALDEVGDLLRSAPPGVRQREQNVKRESKVEADEREERPLGPRLLCVTLIFFILFYIVYF